MHRDLAGRIFAIISLVVLSWVLVSCGGSKSSVPPAPVPNIAGAWELIAYSNTGQVTGIEVALTEGSVLVNGLQQPNGQVGASNAQIAFLSLDPTTLNVTSFGGPCTPINSDNSLGPNDVTSLNAPLNLTFTENGNVFNVAGTLSGDGQSLLNGAYTAQSGNTCADTGGTITGTKVAKISGMYAGSMCPLGTVCQTAQDFTDNVTSTASENSGGVLTLALSLSGADNTNFTLSGPVTGNAFSLQGTFQGQVLTYEGYAEQVYNPATQANVPSLYVVNTTNGAQPNYVGTLQQ